LLILRTRSRRRSEVDRSPYSEAGGSTRADQRRPPGAMPLAALASPALRSPAAAPLPPPPPWFSGWPSYPSWLRGWLATAGAVATNANPTSSSSRRARSATACGRKRRTRGKPPSPQSPDSVTTTRGLRAAISCRSLERGTCFASCPDLLDGPRLMRSAPFAPSYAFLTPRRFATLTACPLRAHAFVAPPVTSGSSPKPYEVGVIPTRSSAWDGMSPKRPTSDQRRRA
jgi:hypothetical protein